MDEYNAWLACVPGMSPGRFSLLMERYKSAAQVFENYDEQPALLGAKTHEALQARRTEACLEACTLEMKKLGITVIARGEESYPRRLAMIDGAPGFLFVQGSPDLSDERAAAVVGTRNCTAYGARMARQIARDLSACGVTVVSGLARGVDGEGHRAVAEAGGRTVAVVGTGLDRVYPVEHTALRDAILEAGGSIVSEYPPGAGPLPAHFPARNRIISGLSHAVLLVEGTEKSGGMITARLAAEQGRAVFALPGQADNPKAEGPLSLLRMGQSMACSAADILREMDWEGSGGSSRAPKKLPVLTAGERKLYDLLAGGPAQTDELLRMSGFLPSELNNYLTSLEILEIIRELPGSRVERIECTEE